MADFGRAMAPFPRVWGENESVDFIMPCCAKINNCHFLIDLYHELCFFLFWRKHGLSLILYFT